MIGGLPASTLIPYMSLAFDSSQATTGPALFPVAGLLIGQKLAAGTGTANTLIQVSNADEVLVAAGAGSMAHRMAKAWFTENSSSTCYVILLDDAGTATASTVPLTFSGTTASVTGELVAYITGKRIAVPVAVGDSFDVAAANLVTAITAWVDSPVTAAYATPTMTLTSTQKGIAAGDIDVRFNYNRGEVFPAGISVEVGAVVPGTIDPDIQDALDAIGPTWVNCCANPYTDNTNMTALEVFADSEIDVWNKRGGMWWGTVRDTRTNLITYGTDTNRNHFQTATAMGYKRLQSTFEVSAAIAGETALSIDSSDVAVPFHRMPLKSISPLEPGDKWTAQERNQLALASIATLTDDNGVQTESTVTMYRKNSAGAADTAYQMQNKVFSLLYYRYTFENRILTKYPRAKLADNAETITSATAPVMTPKVGKAEALAHFKQLEAAGIVENYTQFAEQLIVQRDETNKNRLDWLLPADFVDQFIVGSGVVQFR
jgi:phage tail sheath gpL-like